MRSVSIVAIFAFLLLLLGMVVSCNQSEKDTKDETAKREALKNKIQSELVAKYGAAADWEKELELTPYSIDVEKALVRPSGPPIQFFAYVDDVVREDDKYFVTLSYNSQSLFKIHFLLECKPEVVSNLLSQSGRLLVEVGVVASVSSVRKAAIKLEGHSLDREGQEIEIDPTTSQMFIAKGVCVDLEVVQ